jgi:hypothetical protein
MILQAKSPNADTASQAGFNLANDKTAQRRTFLTPASEGDERHLRGQGKPVAKDSSGGGAQWSTAPQSISQTQDSVASRFGYEGTVSSSDMDRVTDSREKGRIGIFGTTQSYAGSSGRVTHELIGRDLNPLGRGDGNAYVAGALNLGSVYPMLPESMAISGTGNSVNNCGQLGGDEEVLPPGIDYDGDLPELELDPEPQPPGEIPQPPEPPKPPSENPPPGGDGDDGGGSGGDWLEKCLARCKAQYQKDGDPRAYAKCKAACYPPQRAPITIYYTRITYLCYCTSTNVNQPGGVCRWTKKTEQVSRKAQSGEYLEGRDGCGWLPQDGGELYFKGRHYNCQSLHRAGQPC